MTIDRPTPRDFFALLLAGIAAVVAWEVFVGEIIPALGGPRFGPVGLVGAVLNAVIGINPGVEVNTVLHFVTGIVFYQVALLIVILAAGRIGIRVPSLVWGLVWGVATWFIAMGVFASIAGFGFMLGFNAITWWSLAGHIVYAVVAAVGFGQLRGLLVKPATSSAAAG